MGRWAQRTRAGGTVNNFNQMTEALVTDAPNGLVEVTYDNPVNGLLFNPNTFTVTGAPEQAIALTQLSANVIELEFPIDITAETDLLYDGVVAGIITPQTIALST